MTEPGRRRRDGAAGRRRRRLAERIDPARSRPRSTRHQPRSIWPAIYPELLRLVREHTSTIIFVNNRRGAERLAKRLNEMTRGRASCDEQRAGDRGACRRPSTPGTPARTRRARRPGPEIARAHHGSLSHEERAVVEELLKSGELPCLVATSSLELGHRHGRGRPGDPGRVAEVGHPRAAAGRPRRPHARRGLEGPDLPQVPRRPARVRGRRPADARRARSRRR